MFVNPKYKFKTTAANAPQIWSMTSEEHVNKRDFILKSIMSTGTIGSIHVLSKKNRDTKARRTPPTVLTEKPQ